MRAFLVALTIVFVGGCASVPRQELARYEMAFDDASAATVELIRVFAPMEKTVRRSWDEDAPFRPEYARYEAEEGRPGISALIERGFSAVSKYNDVLLRYAEGNSIELLRPAMTTFATESAQVAGVLGLSQTLSQLFKPATDALLSVSKALLAVSDRKAFARVVKQRQGNVSEFLGTLRDITPELWNTADSYFQRREKELLKRGRDDELKGLDIERKSFRGMLASWVLILETTDGAVRALEAAVGEERQHALGATDLAFWAAEIRKHSESLKFSAWNVRQAF